MENMKPALLILAAGIGSRYGGLKQLDKIGPSGETILDYSIFDALRAGFGKVIFIIKEQIEKDFREAIIDRLQGRVEMECVFQEVEKIPAGIPITPERSKPWGTGHAVLMAMQAIDTPFAVINSDDFYGRQAYQAVADFYRGWTPARENEYCMVGFLVGNTLSDFGTVSRGVCAADSGNFLQDVVERTKIERIDGTIFYESEEKVRVPLTPDTVVSMNCWGFTPSFFRHLESGFDEFIRANSMNAKAEFYIPTVVNRLITSREASVKILPTNDPWFGMTYKEDREIVVNSIRKLIAQGAYPEKLWP
jgi:NDP-sugar pyrophosphorylase family protein